MPNPRLERINQDYDLPINARVSTSIHPGQLAGHGEALVDDMGGEGTEIYAAARGAMKLMYQSMAKIDTAYVANLITVPKVGLVKGKASSAPIFEKILDPAKAPELASSMGAEMSRANAGVTRMVGKIEEGIKSLEQRITAATTHATPDRASVVQNASEIRAYIKGLKPESRTGWIQDRITSGDKDVAHAVCNASCYTAGLDPQQHAMMKTIARETFAPRETRHVNAAHAVVDKINAGARAYGTAYYERLPTTRKSEGDKALDMLKGSATS
jgi:hypothetical protein